ncbi:Mannosyl-3-phosphoglycerate synthase [Colletotrichum fructicola Nara gc5]|uniref:Mannosyl-3-phosphoglycerate synthase n=1 Tax=Colletotrichum fructicola (strain Nara gc5) TaxID=1213859 RepID=A0A7J6JD05_COLFN|nr:Mannosyl-3-phosphoglycerate synthase [Colletotrichum fructicola Nara gc5]
MQASKFSVFTGVLSDPDAREIAPKPTASAGHMNNAYCRIILTLTTVMRLEVAKRFEQVGSVLVHDLQRILEMDAGYGHSTPFSQTVSQDKLFAIESKMAIIILCMNEKPNVIDDLFAGIPHGCTIIFVSNSSRGEHGGVDNYRIEVSLLKNFCRLTGRQAIAIHQKDPATAEAFEAAGAPDLIDPSTAIPTIRNGKGEGMLMGMTLAAMQGCEYLGFIDADNYIPGSAFEYCKSFASGLHLAQSADAMVRISWGSKPKYRDNEWVFERRGRCSEVVNGWLNRLLEEIYRETGNDSTYTNIIETGNAGEHAMTMALATKMEMAGGFAVEPYEYIFLLEQMGKSGDAKAAAASLVHIHQHMTRNPHLHDNKGTGHVGDMQSQGLNVIYHSPLTPEGMKKDLLEEMIEKGLLQQGETPRKERVYPAIKDLDLRKLDRVFENAKRLQISTQQPQRKTWL